MKTVLLLGGPAAGQRHEVHGSMSSLSIPGDFEAKDYIYKVVPMCSHGEVHWFGVLDGADPLALLIAGYGGAADKARVDWMETDWFDQRKDGVYYTYIEDTRQGAAGDDLRKAIDRERGLL